MHPAKAEGIFPVNGLQTGKYPHPEPVLEFVFFGEIGVSTLATPEHLQLRKQPKQKRTQALLETIMASTAALVQNNGYQAVNTNAIAQHAGIDIKSLYEFFPNKEAILYRMADQWLASIRETCLRYNDTEFANLNWRDFFATIEKTITRDKNYTHNYISLRGLWDLLPEFAVLDQFHRSFIIDFYKQHLKRFGAKASDAQLHNLCLFVMALEDGIGSLLDEISSEQQDALWQMQFDTYAFHFEKILN